LSDSPVQQPRIASQTPLEATRWFRLADAQ
jgi:hypothetical protein